MMEIDVFYAFIPMPDGAVLAAKIWLPITDQKIPAVLEYIPYRWQDGTVPMDDTLHPRFAKAGFAAVRVDLRGTGNSTGALHGEYTVAEWQDCVAVLDWLAAQCWCTGSVGMIGFSWGGINALQIAALQPPALKAIITLCSSDNLYTDDVHFRGGCLATDNVSWNNTMMALLAAPPDPKFHGVKTQKVWEERLEAVRPWLLDWMQHQTYDHEFQRTSVSERIKDIKVPVLAVGGWADLYTNSVFRLCHTLPGFVRGIVGPWAHGYPHITPPGPGFDFPVEAIRWWDQWLKGEDRQLQEDPLFRLYEQSGHEPAAASKFMPGRWISEENWPPHDINQQTFTLANMDKVSGSTALVQTPSAGLSFGRLCPFGFPDEFPDQDINHADGVLILETSDAVKDVSILGQPELHLMLNSDAPDGQLFARLIEVRPDGQAFLLTSAIQNLTHRSGHSHPKPIPVGEQVPVSLVFDTVAHRMSPNSRLRLTLQSGAWPNFWPAPNAAAINLDLTGSYLSLQTRDGIDRADAQFTAVAPDQAAPITVVSDRQKNGRTEGRKVYLDRRDIHPSQAAEMPATWVSRISTSDNLYVEADDPGQSSVHAETQHRYGFKGFDCQINAETTMRSDNLFYYVQSSISVYLNKTELISNSWKGRIKRNSN